jgi:HEAT repeat protein/CRP-like cAMP-binding protein
MSTAMRFLSRLFNVKAGEWPRLLVLYGMAFVFIAGITWGELSVEATFLVSQGVEKLPQILIANAVVSIVAIALYTPFVDRVANDRLLIAISVIGVAVIGVGWVLLWQGMPHVANPLLYLLTLVVRQTFNLQWWTYVNGFYDTRAAKRIVPILFTASRFAVILAGRTIPLLNRYLSSGGIILVWMGSLLIVALAAWVMPYLMRERRTKEAGAGTGLPAIASVGAERASFVRNVREGYRYVSRSPFLRWVALSTLLFMLLLALLNYHTSDVLTRPSLFSRDDPESSRALSEFLGSLTSWTSLILLPFQLFLFSRVVGSVGLGNANLIFPGGTLLICGALVGWPGLTTAALGYLDRKIFRTVFRNPTDNLLYNAVPLSVKGRARAFIGGLVAPLGDLVGGGLLLLVPLGGVAWLLLSLIGGTAVLYVVSALVVRRRYAQALVTMLEQEDFTFLLSQPSELSAVDSSTLERLTTRLAESKSDDLTIFVANLICESGGREAVPILAEVARTAGPYVRSMILDVLATSGVRSEAVRRLYTEFLDDEDGRVRRASIAGLEQLIGSDSEQFLALALEMLQDADIDVQAQVIPPLVRSGDFFYLASAAQTLMQLLSDEASPERRASAVRVLGEIGDVRFVRNLAEYLAGADDRVRLEAAVAIEALSQQRIPKRLMPVILNHVPALAHDPVERVRLAAVTILGRVGSQEAHRMLVSFLTDPSLQVRQAAVSALTRVGRSVISVVSPSLNSDDPELRKMAAVVLTRLKREQFGSLIESRIEQCLRAIYENCGRLEALSSLEDHPGVVVLRSMLGEQNARLIEEVFYLLAAINEPEAVEIIAESLESEDARVRANAAEALESLTTPRMAGLIAPLFDLEVTTAPRALVGEEAWDERYPATADVIRQLVADPDDPWMRAIVTFALGEIGASLSDTETFTDTAEGGEAGGREERAGSRVRPADLLGMLMDDDPDTSSRSGTGGEAAGPSGEHPLGLKEIDSLLRIALDDPVPDVRIAAHAARRMIAGQRVTDVAHEEEKVLSTIERVIFLKEAPFFQDMTVDQLKVLANICEEQLYPEEARIFEEGDPGGALYVVVSGRVAIERGGQRKGSVVRLATIEAHSYFGEMSFFDDSPRSAAAVAIQDTLMLRLRHEPLVALARQHPDLSLALINVLSQRLRQANDRIAQLARSRPSELERLYDKLD